MKDLGWTEQRARATLVGPQFPHLSPFPLFRCVGPSGSRGDGVGGSTGQQWHSSVLVPRPFFRWILNYITCAYTPQQSHICVVEFEITTVK